jgi:hypothetical protein
VKEEGDKARIEAKINAKRKTPLNDPSDKRTKIPHIFFLTKKLILWKQTPLMNFAKIIVTLFEYKQNI